MRTSAHMRGVMDALKPFLDFALSDEIADVGDDPNACDFLFGNPHEVASRAYVDAVLSGVEPTGPHHFAYTMNDRNAQTVIADGLRTRFGLGFAPDDIMMTNGNFTGMASVLRAICDPGDEVIFVSPPWFFYETLIVATGATPVRVLADRATFDLDLAAIEAAIGRRTRVIIVNSPNNPSGRIYPREQLDALAGVLTAAGERHGEPIHLLSDEAYSRILFDDHAFPTPLGSYPHSSLLYTYGKTHLAPGNRVGYVALHPDLPGKRDLTRVLRTAIITGGWGFPVATLQHAIPGLEAIGPDIARLQRRRDLLVSSLGEQGYELIEPEGTFYILVRSPDPDDEAFCARLREHGVFVLPGATFEMPGWFRISITASDEMAERSIPGFAKAIGA
ncbi:MAG TPA: aminotransferase class I/II-fold pyridoxal phosphate-dependent enzyme [Actinomycetota bacterium]|nr:aminotransferase class I/II-fold pyridoxal phosphate-dependent enzyme [Actinomycetota bacterium]